VAHWLLFYSAFFTARSFCLTCQITELWICCLCIYSFLNVGVLWQTWAAVTEPFSVSSNMTRYKTDFINVRPFKLELNILYHKYKANISYSCSDWTCKHGNGSLIHLDMFVQFCWLHEIQNQYSPHILTAKYSNCLCLVLSISFSPKVILTYIIKEDCCCVCCWGYMQAFDNHIFCVSHHCFFEKQCGNVVAIEVLHSVMLLLPLYGFASTCLMCYLSESCSN